MVIDGKIIAYPMPGRSVGTSEKLRRFHTVWNRNRRRFREIFQLYFVRRGVTSFGYIAPKTGSDHGGLQHAFVVQSASTLHPPRHPASPRRRGEGPCFRRTPARAGR